MLKESRTLEHFLSAELHSFLFIFLYVCKNEKGGNISTMFDTSALADNQKKAQVKKQRKYKLVQMTRVILFN